MNLKKLIPESILKEIGDFNNIQSYKIHGNSFETDKSDIVHVNVELMPGHINVELPPIVSGNDIFYVGYNINGTDTQYRKADYKYLIRILKTVIIIAKRNIEQINYSYIRHEMEYPVFVFGAADKLGRISLTDEQKMQLYMTVLDKQLPIGYRIGKCKIDGLSSVYLTLK